MINVISHPLSEISRQVLCQQVVPIFALNNRLLISCYFIITVGTGAAAHIKKQDVVGQAPPGSRQDKDIVKEEERLCQARL